MIPVLSFVMPDFMNPEIWMSLLTLTFLEIVLGIDNIIFISISSSKLKDDEQKKATNVGLLLAMVLRIVLLFGISYLISMQNVLFSFDWMGCSAQFTGQSLIIMGGGVFLLYKSVKEIHHKLEGVDEDATSKSKRGDTLTKVIFEITVINIVFSFDSILTAVGMTNGLQGALLLMIIAVVLSVGIMMLFAVPVGRFVNTHPTVQMLGLSFLLLIGFMLISEGAHMAKLEILGQAPGVIPKGYLYFVIAFSIMVEIFNIKMAKKRRPVQLHGTQQDASEAGLYNGKPG